MFLYTLVCALLTLFFAGDLFPISCLAQAACQRLEYKCNNGECIPSYNVCDGAKDCSDGSDETRTACRVSGISPCPPLSFECSYGACIDRDLRCNKREDCADGSDEEGCPGGSPGVSTGGSSGGNSCGALKFQCSDGQCINRYDTCDGIKNCNDGSDETKSLCSELVCPASSFQCDYGACLEPSVKCDGKADCPDDSDERFCPTPGNPNPVNIGSPTTTNPVTDPPREGSCRLPSQPKNGAYTSQFCKYNDPRDACRNTPGTLVNQNWLLKYTCNNGYNLNKDTDFSVCENGIWKNELDCIKLCPELKSMSVLVKCSHGGTEVPCDRPMKPGTTATVQCRQHYRPAYPPQYSRLLCLEEGTWSDTLLYCIPDCGIQSPAESLTTLVLNGTPSHQGEFPWLAGIYYLGDSQMWEQNCGGTLITPHIVLTAAHCLVTKQNVRMHPSDLRVGLGKYYRNFYQNESSSHISEVKEVVVPREYSGGESFYALDIGILDLVVSVRVTAYIMPACVDWSGEFSPPPNADGVVAGWGKTEHGVPSETVLYAKLKFIGYDQCLRNMRAALRRLLTHDKFCAGTTDGSQVDNGDSGGGLTFVNPSGQHFLIGIVSAKIKDETAFTLFTDIRNRQHSTWLEGQRTRLKSSHKEL